jgi:hypothetical protein
VSPFPRACLPAFAAEKDELNSYIKAGHPLTLLQAKPRKALGKTKTS